MLGYQRIARKDQPLPQVAMGDMLQELKMMTWKMPNNEMDTSRVLEGRSYSKTYNNVRLYQMKTMGSCLKYVLPGIGS